MATGPGRIELVIYAGLASLSGGRLSTAADWRLLLMGADLNGVSEPLASVIRRKPDAGAFIASISPVYGASVKQIVRSALPAKRLDNLARVVLGQAFRSFDVAMAYLVLAGGADGPFSFGLEGEEYRCHQVTGGENGTRPADGSGGL